MLLAGNALQGIGFAAYLVTESFAAVTGLDRRGDASGGPAFWGSYGNIVAAISLPGERETWFGFLGALRNVGFAIGGLAAGLAVTIGTDGGVRGRGRGQRGRPIVLAFVLLLAVPETRPGARAGHPGDVAGGAARPAATGCWWRTQVGYSLAMMVLNFALPVYVVDGARPARAG